ncbi:hypothetical protein GTCCBUS3UF5_12570 [Geobacillus thermoleovorans CCB_US3_UF5]|uniref:Uncharacterized protein n=1 Tax=Geobacillus thermoleovorans CCB_US3_UF5 TaxID=1111068 RepID=A0ABM5MFZ1_GEOTH|nr:hypothetical protein GTCCBUS3UF5_12570 [Geobacillus thermoleovorans CCB_US3_UF5]
MSFSVFRQENSAPLRMILSTYMFTGKRNDGTTIMEKSIEVL